MALTDDYLYTGYGESMLKVFSPLGETFRRDYALKKLPLEPETIQYLFARVPLVSNSGASTQITSDDIEVVPPEPGPERLCTPSRLRPPDFAAVHPSPA